MILYTAIAARLQGCKQVVYLLVIDLDLAGNHLPANLHDGELLAHVLAEILVAVAVTFEDIPEFCQADAVLFGQVLNLAV